MKEKKSFARKKQKRVSKTFRRRKLRPAPANKGSLVLSAGTLARQLGMIQNVAHAVQSGLPYLETLRRVLNNVLASTGFEKAELYLRENSPNRLAKEITVTLAESSVEGGMPLDFSKAPADSLEKELRELWLGKANVRVFSGGKLKKLSADALGVVVAASGVERLGLLVLSNRKKRLSATENKSFFPVLEVCAAQIGFLLENLRLHHDLVQLAFKDELTGNYNHRFFLKRLREEVDRSERYHHAFSVVLVGLDAFGRFNQTFGFALGDRLLREFGLFLQKNVRSCDVAARLSGDEFGLLLPETPAAGAEVVAQKFQAAARAMSFTQEEGLKELGYPLTVSFGIAVYPENGLILEQLLEAAREALFSAKQEGGDRVVLSGRKVSIEET